MMQQPRDAMYLLVPNESNERVLHPGRIVHPGSEEVIVEFAKAVAPSPGSDVNIFFEDRGKFMQQGATIVAVREADPVDPSLDEAVASTTTGTIVTLTKTADQFIARQTVVFKRIGQPVSAESRGSFRVSVVAQDFFMCVATDRKSQLVDISPEGFGAVTTLNCRLGSVIDVSMEIEGECLEGGVRVQTVRQIGRTRFRCGFLVPSTEKKMRVTLQKMTAAVQRMQLRRLKRTA